MPFFSHSPRKLRHGNELKFSFVTIIILAIHLIRAESIDACHRADQRVYVTFDFYIYFKDQIIITYGSYEYINIHITRNSHLYVQQVRNNT